jgi:hypothetical protein
MVDESSLEFWIMIGLMGFRYRLVPQNIHHLETLNGKNQSNESWT